MLLDEYSLSDKQPHTDFSCLKLTLVLMIGSREDKASEIAVRVVPLYFGYKSTHGYVICIILLLQYSQQKEAHLIRAWKTRYKVPQESSKLEFVYSK